MRKATWVVVLMLVLLYTQPSTALDKKELLERYKNRFAVVMRDGLAVGICSAAPQNSQWGFERLTVKITGESAKYQDVERHVIGQEGCGPVTAEPLHKGEVVSIPYAAMHFGEFQMYIEPLVTRSIRRGIGPSAYESHERGSAFLRFSLPDKRDYARINELLSSWLRPFETAEEAANFGNAATGGFVKEIKVGMSVAQVEALFGLPETKVDLGAKMLYKYKDMTVEFRDGKVADVR